VRRYVYDSGALIAIENRHADAARRHQVRLAGQDRIFVPAPVAAQVVRQPRRQARLMLALRGCKIVPFGAGDAAPVGKLLGSAGRSDVVDGFVAHIAAQQRAAVVTSDGDDIRHLLDTMGVELPVLRP
jgi:predicted nucleic acid-binding protein